jgi:hypothetical protein
MRGYRPIDSLLGVTTFHRTSETLRKLKVLLIQLYHLAEPPAPFEETRMGTAKPLEGGRSI